jgi:hypothetical protein
VNYACRSGLDEFANRIQCYSTPDSHGADVMRLIVVPMAGVVDLDAEASGP